ncbi:MAG: purine-nucleoside phosphorylase [Endomicrobium sp.]|nr:purine-nucleoside phosphorylase [Endomicrobium sp.]
MSLFVINGKTKRLSGFYGFFIEKAMFVTLTIQKDCLFIGEKLMLNIFQKIQETKKTILSLCNFNPTVAIVAGSGLSEIVKQFAIRGTIKYSDIPYFPKATVQGHAGELLLCSCGDTDMLIFNGRFHYYEGHHPKEVVYPVRVMKFLGVETLILTAATGGLNENYSSGDIVVLKDHIDFTGNNPLIGVHCDEFGERFPDMGNVYNAVLRREALSLAEKFNIKVHEGIYFGVSGPSYETPASVRAYQMLGGDVVGMSVVYEATVAAQMKMKVLGLAYVSNMAAGIEDEPLSHDEVLKNGKKVSAGMSKIIKNIVGFIDRREKATG